MSDVDDLRVPPTPDPEKAARARAAMDEAREERRLAISVLRRSAHYIDDPMARAAQHAAILVLHLQLEALTESVEIILGPREPSAAERAGQSS